MFGLLKNKLSNFIKGLSGKEEQKASGQPAPTEQNRAEEKSPPVQMPEVKKEEIPTQPPVSRGEKTSPPPISADKKPSPHPKIPKEDKEIGEKPPIIQEPVKIKEEASPNLPAEKPAEAPPQRQKPIEIQAPVELPKEIPKEEKKSFFSSIASVFSKKEEQKKGPTPKAPEEGKKLPPISPPPALEVKGTIAPKPQAVEQKKEERKHPAQNKETPFSSDSTASTSVDLSSVGRKATSDKREMAPKIGIGTTIKSFFTNEITIGESEVSDLIEELELSLLEADVAYDVSLEVTAQLKGKLVGMKVPKGEVEKRTKQAIGQVLESVMDSERKFDFLQRVKSFDKPVKILFVGPNGAGKTTTMAKIGRMLMDNGMSVVLSASDTFRAAAIEQTEVHAERLGVKAIKSKYGADPSSVAFDAINYARSHSIDVVLIDSAGRQDTNANLLSELKKINRVAAPNLKLYVGESISGNSLLEQIKAFNETIGIDGAILTKLDCDAKGGTAISIAKSTGIPVIFLGVGQRYEDLIPFDPHKIAQEIMN